MKRLPREEVFCYVCSADHPEEIEAMKHEAEENTKRRSKIVCYLCNKSGGKLMSCAYCSQQFHKECVEADKDWDVGSVFCNECEKRVREPTPESIADFYESYSETPSTGLTKVESQPTLFS